MAGSALQKERLGLLELWWMAGSGSRYLAALCYAVGKGVLCRRKDQVPQSSSEWQVGATGAQCIAGIAIALIAPGIFCQYLLFTGALKLLILLSVESSFLLLLPVGLLDVPWWPALGLSWKPRAGHKGRACGDRGRGGSQSGVSCLLGSAQHSLAPWESIRYGGRHAGVSSTCWLGQCRHAACPPPKGKHMFCSLPF